MQTTSKGYLPLALPTAATECHRIPKLHLPLLSIGQHWDAGNTAIFTVTKMLLVQNTDVDILLSAPPVYGATRVGKALWPYSIDTMV